MLRIDPDPVLREMCDPVVGFDARLAQVADDMLVAMYDANGRGLAAPQVGITQRLFVMDASWKDGAPDPQVFVNPRIVAASEKLAVRDEGCLSIPAQTSRVARPTQVTLAWQALDGALHEAVFSGFQAACVQHERDHLDGILCTDYPEAR